MEFNLDDESVEIPCPNCGKEFSERFGKLKNQHQVACPTCGTAVLVSPVELNAAVTKINKGLEELDAAFKALGKKR